MGGALDEVEVVECLTAMRGLRLTVELLAETKAGLLVNSLRKRLRTPQALSLARELIQAWKTQVTQLHIDPDTPQAQAHAQTQPPAPSASPPAQSQARPPLPVPPSASAASPASPRRKRRRSAALLTSSAAVVPAVSTAPPSYSLTSLTFDPQPLSTLPSPPVPHSSSPPPSCSQSALPSSSSSASSSSLFPPLSSGEAALPLYNPNLHSSFPFPSPSGQPQRADGGLEAEEVEEGEAECDESTEQAAASADSTSRKRTRGGLAGDEAAVWLSSSLPPPPSHPVLVCSLVQMCVERLSQPGCLSQLRSLGPLPAPLTLAILARATAEQLRRIEDHSHPQLRADTDELWQSIVRRTWSNSSSSSSSYERQLQRLREALGSWRAVFDAKVKEKDERIQQVGLRLRARGEEERKDRQQRQAQLIDLRQATNSIHRKAMRGGAGRGGDGGSIGVRSVGGGGASAAAGGPSSASASATSKAVAHRLSALRKASGAQSRQFWAKRLNNS